MRDLVKSIDIYPTCDSCFRGQVAYTLKAERKVIGFDKMTPVRVCERCYALLGKPELADEVTDANST